MPAKERYLAIAKSLVDDDMPDEELDGKLDELDQCWLDMTKDERTLAEHAAMRLLEDAFVSAHLRIQQE